MKGKCLIMKNISIVISVLFHPMLMPTIGIFLIFQSGVHFAHIPAEVKKIIYFTVLLTTGILPLTSLPLLYQFRLIKSFSMETSRERIVPVIITGLFYYFGYLLFKRMGVPPLMGNFVLASLVAIIIATVVTYFWKISLHMIGLGGVAGAVMAISLRYGVDIAPWFVLLMFASGVTASSRLNLGAHTPMQVYCGFFVGFIIVFSFILL